MHASQLYIFLVALLVSSVAADSVHNGQWSRRHRTVGKAARSAPVAEVVRSMNPSRRTTRSLGRRSCKAPSNSTSSAVEASTSTRASATATTAKASTTTKVTASTTSTSVKSSSTGSSSGGGALSLDALFPQGTPGESWTTSPKSSSPLPLSDSTFQLTNDISALSHTYMAAPDGKEAMRAIYPEGSYTFTHDPQGGFSFYAPGPDSVNISNAKTVTLGYSVFFEEGFDFNLGGKLPGLYGGDSAEIAIGCSGGRRSTQCYSTRYMFRTNGMGELYTYLPDYEVSGFAANKGVCDIAPFSTCNPTYGASVGRGSWTFPTGEWTTISQRVQLNDVGQANGEIEVWANGKSVISVSGLILRDSASGRHRGIQMQTFFGGSEEEYASPKTQDSYFSDFSIAVIESL
ncbi:polysaccharide lyase family 14 protein [Mycena maculata]|uniref:Polysaccharide lyase family 14 protein n=1 Tax=Mycena maculata TaxID=230809 RepID=A0AAD7KA46_9AGAR|nr:polysaccharide lyase family 14 protein [Mycena maculata]